MPRRKTTGRKTRFGGWDKTLKGLRKRYTVKPKENTIHGGANTASRPSFHQRTLVIRGRVRAHPLPSRLEVKR